MKIYPVILSFAKNLLKRYVGDPSQAQDDKKGARMTKGIEFAEKNAGFSLVEVIFAVAIGASILWIISSLSGNLGILQNFLNQKLQSRQDVDQAFQIMTTEIRSAGQSGLGAYPIVSAGTSSFAFYSDINGDGAIERVRYFLGTSTVWKGVIEPTGSPLTYMSSSEQLSTAIANAIINTSTVLFTYYDSNYTGGQPALTYPIDISAIRTVKFSIYVDVNPSSTPKPIFFSGAALIRNLRSN